MDDCLVLVDGCRNYTLTIIKACFFEQFLAAPFYQHKLLGNFIEKKKQKPQEIICILALRLGRQK